MLCVWHCFENVAMAFGSAWKPLSSNEAFAMLACAHKYALAYFFPRIACLLAAEINAQQKWET